MKKIEKISTEILIMGDGSDINLKLLMDWLSHFRTNYFFLNASIYELSVADYNFQTGAFFLQLTNTAKTVLLEMGKIKVCFCRGHKLRLKEVLNPLENDLINGWRDYNIVFKQNLDSFLEYYLRANTKFIGSWESGLINKLTVLEEAKKVGFKIPKSYLRTNLSGLEPESLISKSFGLSYRGITENHNLAAYTGRIERSLIPENFMTSFVQEEIKKVFEVRSFVFLDEIYSMAIFSQMNDKSEVDYRIYDEDNPYLNEPFKLPTDLENKIFELMRNLNLNTGSIDFIYSEDGDYNFLEVNPYGQFGFLGFVNGLDLYKVMANKILNYV